MRQLKIEVYGRVQGVFLRVNIKEFCDKRGLKGFVTNREDGSVLITAQGDEKKLDELVEWVKQNPGMSRVNEVKVSSVNSRKGEEFEGFNIHRDGSLFLDKGKALKNFGKKLFYH